MCQESNIIEKLYLLANDKNEVSKSFIIMFAESKLPNDFFLQQFNYDVKAPFYEKKYWDSFAKILVYRGLEKTKNVYKKMLIWLQDINWPGSSIIFNYVVENVFSFKSAIKECILNAINMDDEAWLLSLFAVAYKYKGMTEKEINNNLNEIQIIYNSKLNVDELINLFDIILLVELTFDRLYYSSSKSTINNLYNKKVNFAKNEKDI